jgi:hypothetical protein
MAEHGRPAPSGTILEARALAECDDGVVAFGQRDLVEPHLFRLGVV